MRFALAFLVFTSFLLTACDPPVEEDVKPIKKEELISETYPNGNLKARGEKDKSGNKKGVWKYFSQDGTPLQSIRWGHQSVTYDDLTLSFNIPSDYTLVEKPNEFVAYQLVLQGGEGFAPNIVVMNPRKEKKDQKELWSSEIRAMKNITDSVRIVRRKHQPFKDFRSTQMELWSQRGDMTNRSGLIIWDDPCSQIQINFYGNAEYYESFKMLVDEVIDSFEVTCP